MEIHPAINCGDKECFEKRLAFLDNFLERGSFIHFDISDGEYTSARSFFDENILKKCKDKFLFEAHLMIKKKSLFLEKWYSGLFDRVLIQNDSVDNWNEFFLAGADNNVEIGAVVNFDDNYEEVKKIPMEIKTIEILAVLPGLSGQKFRKDAVDLITNFKKNRPDVRIIVDGGINFETGRICAEAGADVLVTSSSVWDSENPQETINALRSIK